jgi:hypothetical protein
VLIALASRIQYMKMAETIRSDRFSSKSAKQRKRVCEGGNLFHGWLRSVHDKQREKSLLTSSLVLCAVGGARARIALRKASHVISLTLCTLE